MRRVTAPTWRAVILLITVPVAVSILPGLTPSANASAAAASTPSLKPLLSGLLDRDGPPPEESSRASCTPTSST